MSNSIRNFYDAMKAEDCEAVLALAARLGGVNADLEAGRRPLHIAAELGSTKMISFLVLNGADINQQNDAGVPPLNIAIHLGQADAVEQLLGLGAKVDDDNQMGVSTLEIAKSIKNSRLIAAISNARENSQNTSSR